MTARMTAFQRRVPRSAAILALVFVAAASVALSPLVLGLVDGDSGEWERLSLIGQTYGAVSALIAVFALVGIAATLVLQARENRRAVLESRRQAMNDLLRMAMDDPDLDACWGPLPEPGDPRHRKQQLYLNMIVSQWQVAFETGVMPEERLRAISEEMFSGTPGRAFWDRAGPKRMDRAGNEKQSRFSQILDAAYRATEGRAEPALESEAAPDRRVPADRSVPAAVALGALAGIVVGACAVIAALSRGRRSGAVE